MRARVVAYSAVAAVAAAAAIAAAVAAPTAIAADAVADVLNRVSFCPFVAEAVSTARVSL